MNDVENVNSKLNSIFTDQNQKILLKGILISLFFLQIMFLSWIINNILLWSDVDFEDIPILYALIIPIVMIVLVLPILPKLMRFTKLISLIRRPFLFIGLIGQLITDYLLYGSINGLFLMFGGSEFGGPLPATWLSVDPTPVMLSGIWIIITFTLVVPSILLNLYCYNDSDQHHKVSWHWGFIILCLMMITRIGSMWSMPYNHLIWTGIMFPFLTYIEFPALNDTSKPNERINMMVLPTAGIIMMLFFWIVEEQVFSGTSLSLGLIWIAPLITNAIILFNYGSERKSTVKILEPSSDEDFKTSRSVFGGIYGSLLIISGCVISISIFSWFAETSLVWIILGLCCLSFIPEILLLQKSSRSILKAPDFIRHFCWILSGIIGIIFPLIASIYDPISTYFGFIILGINAIFVIPPYFKKARVRMSK